MPREANAVWFRIGLMIQSLADVDRLHVFRFPNHHESVIAASGDEFAIGRKTSAVNRAVVTGERRHLRIYGAVGCRLKAVGRSRCLAESRKPRADSIPFFPNDR